VRGYAGGKTWPGVRLIAAVARRGKGSGNPWGLSGTGNERQN